VTYDCLIIGGGLAGLTCGIKCASEGLRTGIISGGMNSLHFSSGSIDIAGYDPKGKVIKKPFDYIKSVIKSNKNHPYSKSGLAAIHGSIDFIREKLAAEGITLNYLNEFNHFHITTLGILKPTYLSQESVFDNKIIDIVNSKKKIAVLNFKGFRDYYPEQAAANIKKHPLFKNCEIILGDISLPYYMNTKKNMHEFRSIDIAKIFETERYLPRIAEEIKKASSDAAVVSLPAFIGIRNYSAIRKRLESMTGKFIYEVPSLPPSILGLRLDHGLKNSFIKHGGEYIAGERVESGVIKDNKVDFLITKNSGEIPIKSKYYLLATGSFFSGGLAAGFNSISEPLFDLKIKFDSKRDKWYNHTFFDKKSHPFMGYGVETDSSFNPIYEGKKSVKNLLCAGSVLSGYNPVIEGCGGGVALATGFKCAERIIKEVKK
jgi:glycerol-3-phosphate dehydrogenase subunit B